MNATSNSSKRLLRLALTSRGILIVACLLIVVGYLLMGGSDRGLQIPSNDIFSTRRIVIAPTFCLAGYLLIIIGILRKG